MLYSYLSVNDYDHLTVAGHDTVDLAKEYGTALFVMNIDKLEENCKLYVDTLQECFGERALPLFASKSLSFTGIYTLMNRFGMGTDIVSCGELYTAKKAGFPLEKAFFHGNNKTDTDIAFAIESGIGYFVVDNEDELKSLSRIAGDLGVTQKILLRIAPGIDPHTHKAIQTGGVDSKFGKAIATNQAYEITKLALTLDNIKLCGFHCHIGSQIFDCQPFLDTAEIMLNFIAEVKARYGYEAEMLNLGGGFGVRYVENDPVFDIANAIRTIASLIKTKCEALGIRVPFILMEPGRSIVADTTVTLYTVGSVKEIYGFRNYVSVDGGMADNPRYALYQSQYTVLTANRANAPEDYLCTIAGRCCESGDLIQEDVRIAKPERGDILAVLTTGAYNYAMASNYNRLPRPAILMVGKGFKKLAVKRESFEDLCRLDLEV